MAATQMMHDLMNIDGLNYRATLKNHSLLWPVGLGIGLAVSAYCAWQAEPVIFLSLVTGLVTGVMVAAVLKCLVWAGNRFYRTGQNYSAWAGNTILALGCAAGLYSLGLHIYISSLGGFGCSSGIIPPMLFEAILYPILAISFRWMFLPRPAIFTGSAMSRAIKSV